MVMLGDLGCLSHAFVEIDGFGLYPVYFYSASRLVYELKTMSEHGRSYIAQTGMIVLPQISIPAIKETIQNLCDVGYFDYMTPMTLEQVESDNPKYWPPRLSGKD